jgi:hypothetical protein
MADPLLVSPKEFIAAVTGKWDIQGIPMVVSVWPTFEEGLKDVLQKLSDSAALNSVPVGWVKKKEWVGLTSEELEFYTEELGQGELGRGVLRAVDDFLREKNSG